mmetsp:Transcript_9164/g.12334  ORF Transcript_9164/g.12334 Transcript_9164/m.12334 type:complete len:171 (+) Transcript_9164:301-813(+)|eukprot:CAMPEP_0201487968 /NCGR_PEP_ID=MMETSP0151_2-20130828/16463_1 /ASSEMBLY_ACC=CAM_ASM_000257 /TAXON_ID=200890 /ORGANISM="Paramoeba atlantica, Strain 621/1 / CCAP 1560/9" /LENGTH=170 /DNA_ID=CAMNT_0047873163 /DNA_START=300 /DNA_END=812 /DNA_ORIENTATION=-
MDHLEEKEDFFAFFEENNFPLIRTTGPYDAISPIVFQRDHHVYELYKSNGVKDHAVQFVNSLSRDSKQGHFVTFQSKQEELAVTEFLWDHQVETVWLGIQEREGVWEWNNGEMQKTKRYRNWKRGHPKSQRGSHCAAFSVDERKWLAVSCDEPYFLLVKYDTKSQEKDEL